MHWLVGGRVSACARHLLVGMCHVSGVGCVGIMVGVHWLVAGCALACRWACGWLLCGHASACGWACVGLMLGMRQVSVYGWAVLAYWWLCIDLWVGMCWLLGGYALACG